MLQVLSTLCPSLCPIPRERSSAGPGRCVQRDVSSIAIAACASVCCSVLQRGCRSPKPVQRGASAPRRAALHWVPKDVGAGVGGLALLGAAHCVLHIWVQSRCHRLCCGRVLPWGPPTPQHCTPLLASLLCTPRPVLAAHPWELVGCRWPGHTHPPPPTPHVCGCRAEPGLNLPQIWGAGEGHCPVPGVPAKLLPRSSWVPLLGAQGRRQHPSLWALSPARPFSSSQTQLPAELTPSRFGRLPFAQKYGSGRGASVAKMLPHLQRAGKHPDCPRQHLLACLRLLRQLCFSPSKPQFAWGVMGKTLSCCFFLAAKALFGNVLAMPKGFKNPVQGVGLWDEKQL